jgi:hypothetical protein
MGWALTPLPRLRARRHILHRRNSHFYDATKLLQEPWQFAWAKRNSKCNDTPMPFTRPHVDPATHLPGCRHVPRLVVCMKFQSQFTRRHRFQNCRPYSSFLEQPKLLHEFGQIGRGDPSRAICGECCGGAANLSKYPELRIPRTLRSEGNLFLNTQFQDIGSVLYQHRPLDVKCRPIALPHLRPHPRLTIRPRQQLIRLDIADNFVLLMVPNQTPP